MTNSDDIVVLASRINRRDLDRLANTHFAGMVKYVVDIQRRILAVGGAMHADAEARLLEIGSSQQDIWGANYYPGRGAAGCIEYVSLINIRPRAGNRSMEIQDAALRERVRDITFELLGSGEEDGWPLNTPT